MEKWFDAAHICKNGHLITKHYNSEVHSQSAYCNKCGAECIHKCIHCEKEIAGCLHQEANTSSLTNRFFEDANSSEVVQMDTHDAYLKNDPPICLTENYVVPVYCSHCGKPYPWTETTLQVAEEIIDMADELDEVARAILKEKFPQILINSSESNVAAIRISKMLKGATNTTVQALKSAFASKVAGHLLELLGWK